jgi:hypothetical protein
MGAAAARQPLPQAAAGASEPGPEAGSRTGWHAAAAAPLASGLTGSPWHWRHSDPAGESGGLPVSARASGSVPAGPGPAGQPLDSGHDRPRGPPAARRWPTAWQPEWARASSSRIRDPSHKLLSYGNSLAVDDHDDDAVVLLRSP